MSGLSSLPPHHSMGRSGITLSRRRTVLDEFMKKAAQGIASERGMSEGGHSIKSIASSAPKPKNVFHMSPEVAVGTVVRLKSGGPRMTVAEVTDEMVKCVWFRGPHANLSEQHGRYNVAMLEIVP